MTAPRWQYDDGRIIRKPNAMPFKGLVQRRTFGQLLVDGEISADASEKWNRETGVNQRPEVEPKVHEVRQSDRSGHGKASR
jgi:hypothetical protein